MDDTGQIEYARRNAWATFVYLSAILIPVLTCIGGAFVCIKKQQSQEDASRSWRYSTNDNDSSLLKSHLTKTNPNDKVKKTHSYDRVYYTHEPLPNRPDVGFEDKDWDLGDANSPTDSILTVESFRKPGNSGKESDV